MKIFHEKSIRHEAAKRYRVKTDSDAAQLFADGAKAQAIKDQAIIDALLEQLRKLSYRTKDAIAELSRYEALVPVQKRLLGNISDTAINVSQILGRKN